MNYHNCDKNEPCGWCQERARRKQAQEHERLQGSYISIWERPIYGGIPGDVFSYWRPRAEPGSIREPNRVWHMKGSTRDFRHRLIRRPHV